MAQFFEDIPLSERTRIGSWTFTPEDITAFARQYDPQPFHLDEDAAKHSLFGGLCASGWHVCSTYIRLSIEWHRRLDVEMLARGEATAELGGSPGIKELRWPGPVLADDTITYYSTVIEKRASKSRPQWGIVSTQDEGLNQRGEPVMQFTGAYFVARKNAT